MLPAIFGENLLDDFFGTPFDDYMRDTRRALYGKHDKNLMKTDIRENENDYEVAVELPGFRKEDLSVDVSDGYLTITAKKGLDKDEKDSDGHYIRRERYAGACARRFYIGDIKAEDIKAKYDAGLLVLTVPKPEAKVLPATTAVSIE